MYRSSHDVLIVPTHVWTWTSIVPKLLFFFFCLPGNPDDTDGDLTSESEDDGSTSLMDQSASTPGNAERSTSEENKGE